MPTSNCLSEQNLWTLLKPPNGSPVTPTHPHLQTCSACHARLNALQDALHEIERYLGSTEIFGKVPNPPADQQASLLEFQSQAARVTSPQFGGNLSIKPGDSISRYRIIRPLSAGGQGKVFLARDEQLRRQVAIKISHSSIAESAIHAERILVEGELLAKVNNPQLVQVYDTGIDSGRPYLVMEYVPGRTLNEYLSQRELTQHQIFQFMLEISNALEVLHQHKIVHLDLKPQNVIIKPDGSCKLVDLGTSWFLPSNEGIAKQVLGGTLDYMAPEQIYGDFEKIGMATDVFGLGIVLLTMLRQRSINQQTLAEPPASLWERASADLDASKGSKELNLICLKAIAVNPQGRFADAREFRKALLNIQARRKARLMFVFGVFCCGLGLWLQRQPLSAQRVPQPTLRRLAASDASTASRVLSPAITQLPRYLKVSARNVSSEPLVFYFWTKKTGLQLLDASFETNYLGQAEWSPKTSREGLDISEVQGPMVLVVMASQQVSTEFTPWLKPEMIKEIHQIVQDDSEQNFPILIARISEFKQPYSFADLVPALHSVSVKNSRLGHQIHCEIDLATQSSRQTRPTSTDG